MAKWKTGDKRKDFRHKDGQQKARKRRKLPNNVRRLGVGEDMDKLEEEEIRKSEFLRSGLGDQPTGSKQSTLRVWKPSELFCRQLAESVIASSLKVGKERGGF